MISTLRAFIVTVRPSGTEPKLKLYCQLLPDGSAPTASGPELLQRLRARADATARQVYGDLLARIDVSLGAAGLLLPDIVDLDRKLEFEQRTVPELQAALAGGRHADLDALLRWLGGAVAAMTPGTDALPALKAPLAWLCGQWKDDLADAPLLGPLTDWSSR